MEQPLGGEHCRRDAERREDVEVGARRCVTSVRVAWHAAYLFPTVGCRAFVIDVSIRARYDAFAGDVDLICLRIWKWSTFVNGHSARYGGLISIVNKGSGRSRENEVIHWFGDVRRRLHGATSEFTQFLSEIKPNEIGGSLYSCDNIYLAPSVGLSVSGLLRFQQRVLNFCYKHV